MLITNGTIISWGENPVIHDNHALRIEDGIITHLEPQSDLIAQFPDEEQVSANGQHIMPGLICAHTHFYGAYARGMAIPGEAPPDFPAILNQLWWPLDKALDADSVRASALVMLVDAIKHGTTTLFDHHASPNYIDGSLDLIADAITEAGLRGVLCYEVTDRDGMDKMYAGIAENNRFIQAHQNESHLAGIFGLHASLTLNDESLQAVSDACPSDVGFHIHVAEHEADEEDSLARSGKRTVHRLHDFGIWRDNSIAAHCIHIDESERKILADNSVWVSHQPRSNMNNGVGAAEIEQMLAEDMKVVLGNDGFSFNMITEWKTAYLLHKVVHRDPRRANGTDIAKIATHHNALLARQYLNAPDLGELKVGAVADMIFMDYNPFTPLTAGNLPWHLLFGFESSMVTSTMVHGKFLMRDRELKTLDEKAIMQFALEKSHDVWQRYTRNAESAIQS